VTFIEAKVTFVEAKVTFVEAKAVRSWTDETVVQCDIGYLLCGVFKMRKNILNFY
jgi:hypothetical protein